MTDSGGIAEFRAEAAAWLDRHAPDFAPAPGRDPRQQARAWQGAKHAAGFTGLLWPAEQGGQFSPARHAIFAEEERRHALPPPAFFISEDVLVPMLSQLGEHGHLDRHAGRAARGDDIWCELFSEPGAGSDLAAIRTRAEREGDDWVVNGQKLWCSFAHWADRAMLVVRTDAEAQRHKGLTMFLIDMQAPGIDVRPLRTLSGEAEFNEVFFTDLRISDGDRIGDIGAGWTVLMAVLAIERAAAPSLPFFRQDLIGPLLDLARRTVDAEGRPAIGRDAVRRELAEHYTAISAIGHLNAATMIQVARGQAPGPEALIPKLILAREAQRIAAIGMDWAGPAGAVEDDDAVLRRLHHTFLSAAGFRIAGGTDEILRNMIAEQILGLPREPRVERG